MKKFVLSALGALGLSSMLSATEPMPFAEEKVKEPAKTVKKAEPIAPTVIINEEVQNQRSGGGFQFGAGIYYIKPFWESNTSLTTTSQSATVVNGATTVTTTSGTQDFDHNYSFAPRVWAGYVGECGLGIRLGWWRFDDNATARATVTPQLAGAPLSAVSAPGLPTQTNAGLAAGQTGVISLTNSIEMNVFDLDITQRLLDNNRWNLTVGAGVRYMEIDQSYIGSSNITGLPAGQVIRNGASSRNEFDAIGPNLILDATRRLGDTGLGLYANGRFGVLFGDSRQESITNSFLAAGAASVTTVTTNTTDREDLIPFLDVEAGVQWQGCGNLKPFARLGVTGQNYFGIGNGSLTTTDTNLGFLGLTATFGISY